MRILKNELGENLPIRTEMDFPMEGIEFIDILPLTMDKEINKKLIAKFADRVKDENIDYVVAPEARGFLFGAAVAEKLGVGFIPVRKSGKIPPSTVEVEFTYNKEYGLDRLTLPKLVNDEYKGRKFYIIDDIYATGNTVKAIKNHIEKLGGTVVEIAVLVNIVELNHDTMYSILDVNEG